MARCRLSVVVATVEPWPTMSRCLTAVEPQVEALSGELIIADGHGDAVPADHSPGCLRRVVRPGASVFELRALAVSRAQGEVVAITEDHCVPAPDWCPLILAAHRDSLESSVIVGEVVNGSTSRVVDWANFLATFAEFLPPLGSRLGSRVPTAANVSFKRAALTGRADRAGWLEFELLPRLASSGAVALDARPSVSHIQSHGFVGTPLIHFHNGRATTGLRKRPRSCRGLAVDLVRRLAHPLTVVRQTRAALEGKPLSLRARLGLPLVAILASLHAAGEATGLVLGPGRSPHRLT